MNYTKQAPMILGEKAYLRDLVMVLLLITSVVMILLYRALIVGNYIANDSIAMDNPVFTIFLRDSGFYCLLLALMFLATLGSRLILAPLLLRVTLIVLLLLYCVDVELFDFFSIRINFGDLIRYGKDVSTVLSLLSTSEGMSLPPTLVPSLPFLVVTLIFCTAYLFLGVRWDKRSFVILSIAACAPVTGFLMSGASDYSPKAWVYDNFLVLNLNDTSNNGYSETFMENLIAKPEESKRCVTGAGKRPDIILLIMESVSNYHSKLYSGLNDWTPQFDEIARENTYLTKFHANGFTTEHGLISLFTGKPFIPGVGEFSYRPLGEVGTSYPRYDSPDSVATDLDRLGYDTMFLTTSDLRFSGKGSWLKTIGFKETYGSELPAYNGWPRLHFHAAPDEALYLAALDMLEKRESSEPFFMVLETVSSHLPYRSIEGPPHTEERVIRYMDKQIGAFYRTLRKRGFFQHGMLLLISDHRAMGPAWPGESALFGLSTPLLIPAALVWDKLPKLGAVDTLFQQADLRDSLAQITEQNPCVIPGSGNFITNSPSPSRCVFHSMGQQREMIYVRCGEEEGLVKLDGDNTRFVKGNLADAQYVLDRINRIRLQSTQKAVAHKMQKTGM